MNDSISQSVGGSKKLPCCSIGPIYHFRIEWSHFPGKSRSLIERVGQRSQKSLLDQAGWQIYNSMVGGPFRCLPPAVSFATEALDDSKRGSSIWGGAQQETCNGPYSLPLPEPVSLGGLLIIHPPEGGGALPSPVTFLTRGGRNARMKFCRTECSDTLCKTAAKLLSGFGVHPSIHPSIHT